jgi:hypothetical protein
MALSSADNPNTNPIWPGFTNKWADVSTLSLLLLLGVFVTYQSYSLGPGYTAAGPEAGFWPFWLSCLYMLGGIVALVLTIRNPDENPFFEATQEVIDLVAVGTPVLVAVLINYWLGIFATSVVYLAFFMWWYGKFRVHTSIIGGIIFGVALWLMIRKGFNLSMPMSWLYYQNITPF